MIRSVWRLGIRRASNSRDPEPCGGVPSEALTDSPVLSVPGCE